MTDTSDPSSDPPEQPESAGPGSDVPAAAPFAATASDVPASDVPAGDLKEKVLVVRIFNHVPHPRYEHHHLTGPTSTAKVASEVHGKGFFGRLNSKVGLRVTLIVGTMWAAYLFLGLALYGLPQAIRSGPGMIVLWTSSEFLQLVLLPIIIVGQNIQAKASDARAEETYNDAEAIMHECLQLQTHLHAQDEVLLETIDHVRSLAASLSRTASAVAGGVAP